MLRHPLVFSPRRGKVIALGTLAMRIQRLFLNRLDVTSNEHDVVVVIDVLRSFTTAAYAFAAGARAVHPVETIAAAWRLKEHLPGAITTGAFPGGDPVPGFDFGNSPTALAAVALNGTDVIQTTAAGVQGLLRFAHAPAVFAGSLVCAAATAATIRKRQPQPQHVTLLITGEWIDRDGDEDVACADYLEALLRGDSPDPRSFEMRVRDSDFGRRFAAGTNPSLPAADLDMCACADHFSFAMPAIRQGENFVLTRCPV